MNDIQKLIKTLSEVKVDYEQRYETDPNKSLMVGFAGGLGLAINFIKKQVESNKEIYVEDDVYFQEEDLHDESKLA